MQVGEPLLLAHIARRQAPGERGPAPRRSGTRRDSRSSGWLPAAPTPRLLHTAILIGPEVGAPADDWPGRERRHEGAQAIGQLLGYSSPPPLLQQPAGWTLLVTERTRNSRRRSPTPSTGARGYFGPLSPLAQVHQQARRGDGWRRSHRGSCGARLLSGGFRPLPRTILPGIDGHDLPVRDLRWRAAPTMQGIPSSRETMAACGSSPPSIGDDRRSPAHYGRPVRRGHARPKMSPSWTRAPSVAEASTRARPTSDPRRGPPGHGPGCHPLVRTLFLGGRGRLPGSRHRARLDNIDLAALNRPFHILRRSVVLADPRGPVERSRALPHR